MPLNRRNVLKCCISDPIQNGQDLYYYIYIYIYLTTNNPTYPPSKSTCNTTATMLDIIHAMLDQITTMLVKIHPMLVNIDT